MVNLPPPEPNEQPPTGRSRDNDEAIAIAIALLSVGAILWWGWTRGGSLFTPGVGLPQLSGSSSLVEDESLTMQEGDERLEDAAPGSTGEATDNRRGLFSFIPFLGNGDEAATDNADTLAQAEGDGTAAADAGETLAGRGTSDAPATAVPGTDTAASGTSRTDTPDSTAANNATEDTTGVAPDGTAAVPSDSSPSDAASPAPLPELSISDVSEDYWAYPYIVSLFEAGLLPNFPSGNLQPDKELTRAELAALLSKSIVADAPPKRSLTFSDVSADFWAANDIKQVVDAGYMTGFPEGTFRPNEIVPRYQMFITMATGLELSPPADVDGAINQYQGTEALPGWARSQVAAAADQGLIVNHPDPQQLAPQAPATRADLIAVIHQALVAQGRIDPVNTP